MKAIIAVGVAVVLGLLLFGAGGATHLVTASPLFWVVIGLLALWAIVVAGNSFHGSPHGWGMKQRSSAAMNAANKAQAVAVQAGVDSVAADTEKVAADARLVTANAAVVAAGASVTATEREEQLEARVDAAMAAARAKAASRNARVAEKEAIAAGNAAVAAATAGPDPDHWEFVALVAAIILGLLALQGYLGWFGGGNIHAPLSAITTYEAPVRSHIQPLYQQPAPVAPLPSVTSSAPCLTTTPQPVYNIDTWVENQTVNNVTKPTRVVHAGRGGKSTPPTVINNLTQTVEVQQSDSAKASASPEMRQESAPMPIPPSKPCEPTPQPQPEKKPCKPNPCCPPLGGCCK